MTKATDLAELAAILALSAKPHRLTLHKGTNVARNAVADAAKLMRYAARLQRLAEQQCNGIERWEAGRRVATWTEADQDHNDKAVDMARKAITTLVHDYYTEKCLGDGGKLAVYFQRDPRGSPVHIAFKAAIWAV